MQHDAAYTMNSSGFPIAGGMMGALIRTHDWSSTPLGPCEAWPSGLRATVDLVLGSPMAMVLLCGPELVQIYNDSYAQIMGPKHPAGLGQPNRLCWPEVWAFNAPIFAAVFNGEARSFENQKLIIERSGQQEDAWFNLTYSPLRDERGAVASILVTVVETTERLLAERRDVAERKRLSRMFEQAPSFMAMLSGRAQRFDFVNPAYEQLVGHRSVVGRSVREALPELEGQGYHELLDTVFTTGEPFVGRAVPVGLQRRPGAAVEQRFIDLVYQPVTDPDGAVTGIFVEGSDVTERVVAEADLRVSEQRLNSIFTLAAVGLAEIALDGRFRRVNDAFCRMLGRPREDLLARDFSEVTHPDDVAVSLEQSARIAETGRPASFDKRYLQPNGALVFVNCSLTRLDGEHGHPPALLSVTIDMTERVQAEAALRASEEFSRRVIQSSADCIKVLDLDARVLFMSEGGMQVMEVDDFGAVEGACWPDLWRDDEHAKALAAVAEARRGETGRFQGFATTMAGAPRWWDVVVTPINGPDEVPVKLLSISRDITASRKAEAQLRELNDSLEARAAERAAELTEAQDQLRQSQKLDALGQLTGGVAHDFNNLLTIIRSSAELLRRHDLPEERRRRYVNAIVDTTERAAALTRQLLAFARRQALKPEVFDAAGRVRGIAGMLQTLLGVRIQLVIDVAETPCFVEADLSQFETALVNMAVNARDAMEGEGKLTVAIRVVAALPPIRAHQPLSKDHVALSITDTGAGIDADTMGRVFEPFFTTKKTGQGTGLGLSQVYGFAKQSGGDVDVASRLGEGACFTLYLPQSAPPALAPPEINGPAGPRTSWRSRVLVVEDDAQVAEFAVLLLRDSGHETTLATSAAEALGLLGEDGGAYDVVFSDVVMPGMSGIELADLLRTRRPELPVVLTSGYSHVLAEEGRYRYPLLHKPYSAEDLSQVIQQATGAAPPTPSPSST
ncbi:PAS domain-containing protein [Falsiroseomonas sp. E2-1-a20]|uniref:PAS domain-containing hybrid sensor histidine kinase/response regulator n=1 Tax=Falsiroseomonas sp. E2-1-a20 TaxID=3239300 RepID=UPI003F38E48D